MKSTEKALELRFLSTPEEQASIQPEYRTNSQLDDIYYLKIYLEVMGKQFLGMMIHVIVRTEQMWTVGERAGMYDASIKQGLSHSDHWLNSEVQKTSPSQMETNSRLGNWPW